uniref:Glucagon receptor b n=1 Tax=Mastacembelus armatus TaxID=205130 RepID=A0A7N8YJD3_9TELE
SGMSQVYSLLALLVLCSCIKVNEGIKILLPTVCHTLVKEQWSSYKNQCLDYLNATPPASGVVCNRTFDLYACWPDGLPGTTVNVSCPWFLPWYHKGWYVSVCIQSNMHILRKCVEVTVSLLALQQQYGRILSQLRIMYTVGYSLSLGALLLALGILITFRKLHCMRNNIHMNLFASFILRAVSILVKDRRCHLFSSYLCSHHLRPVSRQAVTWCRGAVVMMQYSVMANNYWLLVEGIYLHSLLVITVFSERKYFYIYLAIGWGAPLIFVLPWITVKYMYENEECWERNINMGYWWIIRSPILFAYVFLVILKTIPYLPSRLAKSTLTLIPLLGIHAILFTFVIDESVPKGSMLRLIRLFCDLLFNSFQVRPRKCSITFYLLNCFVEHFFFSTILCTIGDLFLYPFHTVHPGQGLLHGTHRLRHSHSHLWTIYSHQLAQPQTACILTVGGSWSIQRR